MKKREANGNNQDRISDLPDSILLDILSLLPMEEAVATGVLSWRWNCLWTNVTRLMFSLPPDGSKEELDKFINFVNHTISLHEAKSIKRFAVHILQSDDTITEKEERVVASHVDTWIRFAVRRGVEDLYIYFYQYFDIDSINGGSYRLPCHIFCNDSLRTLGLAECSINPTGQIQWSSLKTLKLYYIQLSDDLIQNILSGAPLLESLCLSYCIGIRDLNFTFQNLDKLELSLSSGLILNVNAPHITTLTIRGGVAEYNLMEVLSLDEVEIILELETLDDSCLDFLRRLFESVCHIKIATLSTHCLQVLSMFEVQTHPCSSWDCSYLELKTNLTKWELPGITIVLRTSPNLQTLIIQKDKCECLSFDDEFLTKYDFDESNYLSSLLSFPCLKKTLQFVEVYNFGGGSSETSLIEFLLKRTQCLRKMKIYCRKAEDVSDDSSFTSDDVLKFSQKLLRFRRASSDAEVLLY